MCNIISTIKTIPIIFFCLLFQPNLFPQKVQSGADIFKLANQYITEAMQEYKKKNFANSAELFEKANNIRPGHPTIMYNLSAASALSGNSTKALDFLNRLAEMKLVFHPEEDRDFALLWGNDYFKTIIEEFQNNNKPAGQTNTAFYLNENNLITEGMAYYPKTNIFYISSIHKRKIISVGENGSFTDFISSGVDGIWGIFGMAVDTSNGVLWVCTSAVTQIQNYNNTDSGKAGVFKYDLATKKLIKKYILDDGNKHVFGDLALSSAGDIFVSDSKSNRIYVIDHERDILEEFFTDGFISLQGLTLSQDNSSLFIADYASGIYEINTATKQINKISFPDSICTLGTDGLYFYKNSLIAVQNGINPNRVVRLFLSDDQKSIISYKILAANNFPMEDPTLGVFKENNFFFIANSQWNKINENGFPQPYEKWETPTILRINLEE